MERGQRSEGESGEARPGQGRTRNGRKLRRDRYQEALRELIEAKMKGLTVKPREIAASPPVIDLMAALKRSLAQEAPAWETHRLGCEQAAEDSIP